MFILCSNAFIRFEKSLHFLYCYLFTACLTGQLQDLQTRSQQTQAENEFDDLEERCNAIHNNGGDTQAQIDANCGDVFEAECAELNTLQRLQSRNTAYNCIEYTSIVNGKR